jgi:metal-responsive CopG/Arc/MetJ family transcriptional regulator
MEKKQTAEKARYLPTLFPESLLKRIDDYRFENRLASRAEAIRQLIEAGLQPQTRRRKSA